MIKIEIKWYEDFVNKVWHLVVDPYVNTAIKKSIINFERAAKIETPVDTGNLRQSYESKFWYLEWELRNTRKYWIFVHEPTRPHTPPLDAITPWARRKGIPAWAVWMSIKKKGTKWNPWMTRAMEQEEWRVEQFFSREMDKLFNQLK